ncbi:MAG: PilZ domain-containing protein [Myxococcota bacterium]
MFPAVQKHPRYATQAPVSVLMPDDAGLQRLCLHNVSLGGVFVRTLEPAEPGATVHVLFDLEEARFSAAARVVHVVDEYDAKVKSHPCGMGLQFESLEPHAGEALNRLLMGLQDTPPSQPVVSTSNEVPAAPDEQVPGAPAAWPAVESRVPALEAPAKQEKVEANVEDPGATLDAAPEDPPPESTDVSLEQIVAEAPVSLEPVVAVADVVEPTPEPAVTTDATPVAPVQPALSTVLAAVERFLAAWERGELGACLGLPRDATLQEMRAVLESLVWMTSSVPEHASDEDGARILKTHALLPGVARELERKREPERKTYLDGAKRMDTPMFRAMQLAAQAEREEEGSLVVARDLLRDALALAPTSQVIRARLDRVERLLQEERARMMVEEALAAAQVGRTAEAQRLAEEARKVWHGRLVRLTTLRVLELTGAVRDAIDVATALVREHPQEEVAWHALVRLQQRIGRTDLALEAAETLARLQPGDLAAEVRCRRLRSATRV